MSGEPANDPGAPRAGHRLVGRYLLEAPVGAGGMGEVWRATDTVLDRVVAVKRVRIDGLDPAAVDESLRRVQREAKVAARLHHPNAVTIFDVVTDEGLPWLVLEYVPSRSLAEVLAAGGPLAPDDVAHIGAAIGDALTAAHAAGIVHRDVKPANVLLGPAGVVKLTDFGISRISGDLTLTSSGALIGTPAYLAPEVARGGAATPASDVFCLGATLYAAVEGTPPYGGAAEDNLLGVLRRAAEGVVPPPRRAGALAGPLMQLLAPDPQRRPTAAAVRHLLTGPGSRAAAPTVSGPPPVRWRDPASPAVRRGPLLAGLAAVLVVALVVTLVVIVRPGQGAVAGPAAAAPPGPAACDTSRGTLTVGMVAPLSGPLAALGLGMRNAGDLAVEQANAACAVPGYRLVLQAEDDQATPAVAATVAERLVADPGLIGVIGTLNSSTAQVVQPVVDGRGIVMVSPANTSPALTQGADYTVAPSRPYGTYFRISTTDAVQGPFAAQYLVGDIGLRTIAVIDDGKAYGAGLADAFVAEAERLGALDVSRQRVGENDTDFSSVIAAIRDSAPEAVYYGGEYPAAAPLSAQLAAAGLDVPLVGGDGIITAEYVRLGGRPGDLATSVGAPPEQLATAQGFLADYAAAGYPERPEAYGASTYDATTVVVRAVAAALGGGEWSESSRPAVVRAVQDTAFDGATGPVSFDGFGDPTVRLLTVYAVEGDSFVPVESGVHDTP